MSETARIRILVVDDEPQIVRALRINLKVRGYDVATAASGAEALRVAANFHPEIVLLDLGLPDFDGIDVIGGLRGWTDIPIVVLSARTDSADTVEALDAGADDFVTKPFEMDALLARLRAALRRGPRAVEDAVVVTDSFIVDLAAKRVTRGGETVHLTRTEWGVLELLARNRGKLVSQKEILQTVWGPRHERETHYLRIYLGQLRQKLEDDPSHPRHLLTETGMGYRLV
ncbi:MAG: response regulator [Rhodococcus sp. (in: high G+C Gram-positive bacteria)]|jgi:two-component system, OmpR family, KDP operon response regulator KdpE|uniref:response regulator n=1 Tax=Rhodococcus sp. EPR-157 TaxID=1813677 RepID=UPI0007BB12C6|nr:response regulator [Rhodococcus sp. EPR-157]KZF10430.1 DNA-binding response regulator [Rhodococcus sp. EPR-157]